MFRLQHSPLSFDPALFMSAALHFWVSLVFLEAIAASLGGTGPREGARSAGEGSEKRFEDTLSSSVAQSREV